MPEEEKLYDLGENDIAEMNESGAKWTHGALGPLQVQFWAWSKKDPDRKDADGNPVILEASHQVTKEEFHALPSAARGQKVFVSVDPRPVNPTLKFVTTRSFLIGFEDWATFLKSVQKVLAEMEQVPQEKALNRFREMAQSGKWFVEMELVSTGRVYKDRVQTTFRLSRMTTDVEQLLAWNNERYPKRAVEMPAGMLEDAQNIFIKFCKRDVEKFRQMVESSEEMKPFEQQLLTATKAWLA